MKMTPITALLLLEMVDPEGIDTHELQAGDEVDESVADMVAHDAAEVVENHYRVKATVVRGFDRLEAIARQILDEVYPADIFGTADDPDSDASDPGVRLVRALRACDAARANVTPPASAAQTFSPLHGTQGKDQR